VPRSRSTKPRIPPSGVRISWLIFARNWFLALFASSAREIASVSFFRREETYAGRTINPSSKPMPSVGWDFQYSVVTMTRKKDNVPRMAEPSKYFLP
jgi:hypothetical protein